MVSKFAYLNLLIIAYVKNKTENRRVFNIHSFQSFKCLYYVMYYINVNNNVV